MQVLMTDIYKIVNSITPTIMNSLLEYRLNIDNLQNFQKFFIY